MRKNAIHGEVAELAEGNRLLSDCPGKPGPRVRIPASPPFTARALATVAVTLAAAVLIVGVGCKGKKRELEEKAQSAAPRPVTEQQQAVPEVITPPPQGGRMVADEEVRKHWRAVEIIVFERAGAGAGHAVEIPIGGEAAVPGTPLKVRVLSFLPEFQMGLDSLTTKSMEDRNPAVKIRILEGETELFEGWSFRDHPEQHAFEDSRYTIRMTRALAAGD